MVGKFSCNLAELTQPLRELIKKGRVWAWDSAKQKAFTTLIHDPNAATKIIVDASSYGLRAVYCFRSTIQSGNPWHMLHDQ